MPVPAPSLSAPPQATSYTPVAASQDEVDAALQQLASGDDRTRAQAAVQLGRLHAGRAVEPLTRALEQDRNPTVREAAARGLGLIGAPSSLSALQRAAQADDDRDVRNSASFAADIIRSNMPR
jgi:HEAT repeat protein